jgi:hypothetical protein
LYDRLKVHDLIADANAQAAAAAVAAATVSGSAVNNGTLIQGSGNSGTDFYPNHNDNSNNAIPDLSLSEIQNQNDGN